MYEGQRCRERVKLEPTPANIKRAEKHKAAIEFAIAAGTFDYAKTFPNSKRAGTLSPVPSAQMAIAKYARVWLEQNAARLRASTFKNYGVIIARLEKSPIGSVTIGDFRRRHLREWFSTWSANDRTYYRYTSIYRTILGQAVEDELIPDNPLTGWVYKGAIKGGADYEVDPFSAEEQAAILGALTGQQRNLIQFAFWTGLRTSELIALEWGDIDFIGRAVSVNKAHTAYADAPESTKTTSGRRMVRLHGPALAALADQKRFTFLAGGRIFHNPNTGAAWLGDQSIRAFWTSALKRAGVRYRIPYQTRHTFASMMLSAGESPLWVSKQMGHANWQLIGRTYGKWMPDADPDAGSKAEALYGAAFRKARTG